MIEQTGKEIAEIERQKYEYRYPPPRGGFTQDYRRWKISRDEYVHKVVALARVLSQKMKDMREGNDG